MVFLLLINTLYAFGTVCLLLARNMPTRAPPKLTRSLSVANTHLNCFGSFDGIHNLLLGKFRFGLELKRAKSVCDNQLMLEDNNDIYLPSRFFSQQPLAVELANSTKQLRRAVSYNDLSQIMLATSINPDDQGCTPPADV